MTQRKADQSERDGSVVRIGDRRLAERPLLRAPRRCGGRVGFAPFVVRPRRLGVHRVAVVLPTLTWQAYNLRDDDGDGKRRLRGTATGSRHTVRLGRPFLNRGVPYNFRRYDLSVPATGSPGRTWTSTF